MQTAKLSELLSGNAYPGRGIVIGRSEDGSKAVTAYFIMGRSVNSRNRVFKATADGIKTEAFDPSKLSDPHLIIYSPVRVLGNKTIVTNGDQTDTGEELHVLDGSEDAVVDERGVEHDDSGLAVAIRLRLKQLAPSGIRLFGEHILGLNVPQTDALVEFALDRDPLAAVAG